jgi:hypothetical protein
MINYDKCKAIDFVNNQAFRDWVFDKKQPFQNDLSQWIEQNPSLNPEAKIAKLYLQNIQKGLPDISENDLQEKIKDFWKIAENRNIQAVDKKTKIKWNFFKIVGIAASIILVVGMVLLYFKEKQQSKEKLLSAFFMEEKSLNSIEKINKTNTKEEVILPDGSKIMLEPNSSIVYPKTFDDDIREVHLMGEAFFDVVRNPDKPFIVHFNELVVKVLGTSFIIKANKNDSKMQVLVKTGKVSVFAKDDWQKVKAMSHSTIGGVIITANQQVEYLKITAKFQKTIIENPEIIDALTQEEDFTFEETPLIDVLRKIERAYGITILVDEHQIANCTITAVLSNEPLLEKLNLISKIIHAKYEMIDGQVIMNVKSCH